MLSDTELDFFRCEAENVAGVAKTVCKVHVEPITADFVEQLTDVSVYEHSELSLRCTISNEKAKVEWQRDGRVISPSDDIHTTADGPIRSLTIREVTKRDSGTYTCVCGKKKTTAKVTVNGKQKIAPILVTFAFHTLWEQSEVPHFFSEEPVRIVSGPTDQTITSFDETVEFVCQLSKPDVSPTPDWYKDGKLMIDRKDKIEITEEGDTYKLIIRNVQPSDAGQYVVKTETESATVNLNIEIAPIINVPEKYQADIELERGATLRLAAEATGAPTPTVTWSKDSEILNSATDSRVSVRTEPSGESTLSIREVTKEDDEGVYQVAAENQFGRAIADFRVHIADVPSAPENLEVTDIFGDRMTLRWEPPASDGGRPVTTYVVEKKDTSKIKWHHAGRTEQTTLTVTDLLEKNEYLFRVTAVNDIGSGPSAETTEPILAKSPYTTPKRPGPPEVSDIGRTECTLRWEPPSDDGGSAIIGYRVEKKDRYAIRFAPVSAQLVTETETKIEDLLEGNEYEFRVIAVNAAGESEPSFPSQPVMAKAPYDAPGKPEPPTVSNVRLETSFSY